MTGLRDDLIFQAATYPYNFLILPDSPESGKIQIMHYGFTLAQPGVLPIVAGVLGNRRSSPFKAFDPKEAVSSLEVPVTKTRSQGSKTTPTIEQFLKVNKDADELKRLEGPATGESVERLTNWRNSYIIHPEIFILLGGVRSLRADDAAIII
jgi:hypothetical protein